MEVPEAADVPTSYAGTPLEQSEDAELAQAWIDLVISDDGQAGARGGRVHRPVSGRAR